MSKIVKSVARAISRVVSGVVNAIKKVAQSKLGKVILTAAAVYFGGAALAGGMGSAAGSGISGFLSGAGTGVANAATSLSQAWSAALGGNFAQAGSALSSGLQGQAAGAATNPLAAAPAATAAPGAGAFTGATSTGLPTVAADAANVLAPAAAPAAGAGAGAASSGLTQLGQYGLITGGMQLAGGVISGIGQQKAMEDQRAYELQQAEAQRARYNQNVGTNWWGSGNTGSTGDTGATAPGQPAPGLIAGSMPAANQSYKDYMDNLMKSYNPYALPTRA